MHDAVRTAAVAAVLGAGDREPALDHVARVATLALPAIAAVISTERAGGEVYKAWWGIPEPLAARRTVPLLESLTRGVLREGRVLAVTDTGATGNALAHAFDWAAWLGAPLRLGDVTVGALWVADGARRNWSERDVALLEGLGATAVQILLALADRHTAGVRLRDHSARYEALSADLSAGVWCVDLDVPVATSLTPADQAAHILEHARLAECNEAFAHALARTFPEDLLGARFTALFDGAGTSVRTALTDFVRNGYSLPRVRLPAPSGARAVRDWTWGLEGVVDAGRLVRVWGVVRWPTDAATGQAAAAATGVAAAGQKADALGRLAAGVAHEFNNVLTTIRGRAELALRDSGSEPWAADLVEIRQASDRAVALTRQLYAFGREHEPSPELMRPDRTAAGVDTVLQHLAGDRVTAFRTDWAPDTGPVFADVGGFERALVHLVSWLRDAAPAGGQLRLWTANERLTGSEAAELGIAPGPCVVMAVTHSLLRLDADTIARIVEPEFSPRGVGGSEGLVAALAYARRSQGNVRITSDEHGTTIALVFPRRAQVPGRKAVAGDDAPAATGGGETVLVVEDQESVRGVARRTLLLQGYNVMEAENAEVALELAAAYVGRIHVLLTDVMMPGLSGTELAQRIGEIRPDARIVLMSGFAGDLRPTVEAQPGAAFLEKPFTPMVLARTIRQVLDRTD